MERIFKYQLDIVDEQTLNLPYTAKILSVIEQHNKVVLYAAVDDEHEPHQRLIRIVGTGHPFPDIEQCVYLGTVSTHDGHLIWHVFEERQRGD